MGTEYILYEEDYFGKLTIDEMSNRLTLNFTEEQLCDMIVNLCDILESFKFASGDNIIELKTNRMKNLYCSLQEATIQEALRKRFSNKERKKRNKDVIKFGADVKNRV